MKARLNRKKTKEIDWQKSFIRLSKEKLKEMKIANYSHNATICLSWQPQCAKSIVDVFLVNKSQGDMKENLGIYLIKALFDYYKIDSENRLFRLFIKAGMSFDNLLDLKESLEDPNHKSYLAIQDLNELLEIYDEEEAFEEVKSRLKEMKKKKKKKKKKKNKTLG